MYIWTSVGGTEWVYWQQRTGLWCLGWGEYDVEPYKATSLVCPATTRDTTQQIGKAAQKSSPPAPAPIHIHTHEIAERRSSLALPRLPPATN